MPALDGFGADLKHHHHLLYNAADIVEIKKRSIPTPSFHQRKQQKTQDTNLKAFIYSYLLSSILLLLRFIQLVQLYSKRIYYIGLDLFESLGLRDTSSLRSSSSSYTAPNHVCIILNETIRGIDELSDKISLIVDLMSSHGTRLVTFYAHEQLNLEFTEKIAKKYSNEDVNNNNNGIDVGKRVEVRFVTSSSCGKGLLVNACRRLSHQVKSKRLEASQITQGLVDRTIQGIYIIVNKS